MTHYVLVASEWLQFSGLLNWINSVIDDYNRNRKISNTIEALSKLSDKELKDIGISRGDIWSIAHEAYYDDRRA